MHIDLLFPLFMREYRWLQCRTTSSGNQGYQRCLPWKATTTHDKIKKLCPVDALRAYEDRTKEKRGDNNRSQLLIAVIKPCNPVSSSTIARWIKTVLTKSGIDTDTFKAHSVRSASGFSVFSCKCRGHEILKAADWSSESVFQKFYFKPERRGAGAFGTSILSSCQPLQSNN